jgi:hypothetical protein
MIKLDRVRNNNENWNRFRDPVRGQVLWQVPDRLREQVDDQGMDWLWDQVMGQAVYGLRGHIMGQVMKPFSYQWHLKEFERK